MKNKSLFLLIIIFAVFISLGLPDALLGSSWNLIRDEFNMPLGTIGFTTVTAFVFTVVSTYYAPRLLSKYQTKQIVSVSLLLTSSALIGMSLAPIYLVFILLAVPLGLGAGAIDFSINHYVASHYKASHMNYLHSFYGVGVLIGPMIMSITLQNNLWRSGYLLTGSLLILILIVVLLSSRLWFKETTEHREENHDSTSFKEAIQTKGAKLSIFIFLIYVHIESLFGVLVASYFYLTKSMSFSEAAHFTLFYYVGLALGRFLSGLFSNKVLPNTLIRYGAIMMLIGSSLLFIQLNTLYMYLFFIFLIGLGSAPIFPNMIHMNEVNFNKKKMSKIMSLQMTFAYISFGVLTPMMGFVFQWTNIEIYPYVSTLLIAVLIIAIFVFINKMSKTSK
jgi:fucose permease